MLQNQTIYIAHNWSNSSICSQSKALALELSRRNKVIFLNAKKSGFHNVWINPNLLVLEWPGKRPTGLKDFLFAVRLMRKNHPHIVISNFAANNILIFTSWLFGVKDRVCYYHTMVQQHVSDHGKISLRQRINIFRKSLVFKMATHMLPCSSAAKNDLLRYYRVREVNAFVFPNALPDTIIRNNGNNCKRIGFLGRFDRSKGADILISAFQKVSEMRPDVVLEIAGLGIQQEELRASAAGLKAKDKIIFRGALPYGEVLDFLSSINFLVVPSRIDNLPTVVLEAFSVATPVIGSNAGGIPDMIVDGYNGLLFEKENAEGLSKKMMLLLNNKEQRDRMAVNARKTFEEKYCVDQLAERFEALLESKKINSRQQNSGSRSTQRKHNVHKV